MMALSGVRSSWLMLETNCDLFSLANCELTVLVLNFVEQPHVLDRDHRLIGENGDQLDLPLGEWAHGAPRQREHADWRSFTHERHAEHGVHPPELLRFGKLIVRVRLDVENMHGGAFEQRPADRAPAARLEGMCAPCSP